jgi:bifunctional non-homologous end joining protein LigD
MREMAEVRDFLRRIADPKGTPLRHLPREMPVECLPLTCSSGLVASFWVGKRTQTRFSARMIQGAKPSEMPGFIAPQLATSRSKAPSGNQWLHEIKYDGYRVQLHVNKQRRTIFTRGGLDWTKRFSVIAGAFDIPVERAILDGEIVVVKDGRTSFSELQAELAKGNQDCLLFYAFDLLYLEGFDLRKAPLVERKRILKMLFDETGLESPIIYSEHLQMDGNKMLAHACKLKFEGIISKNAEAPAQ